MGEREVLTCDFCAGANEREVLFLELAPAESGWEGGGCWERGEGEDEGVVCEYGEEVGCGEAEGVQVRGCGGVDGAEEEDVWIWVGEVGGWRP